MIWNTRHEPLFELLTRKLLDWLLVRSKVFRSTSGDGGFFEYLNSDSGLVNSFLVAAALDKAKARVGRGFEKSTRRGVRSSEKLREPSTELVSV